MTRADAHTAAAATHRDGGWRSRKLWLTVFAMLLVAGLGVVSGLHVFAGLASNLPGVIGGVLGALAVFSGANIGAKLTAAGITKAAVAAPHGPADTVAENHGHAG